MFKTAVQDILFIANRVHKFENHYKKLNIDVPLVHIIKETSKLAENILYPLYHLSDKRGCTFNKGHVITSPGFKSAYKTYKDGGWQGIALPEEYGGSGLPLSSHIIKSEILATSNWAWSMYPGLGFGAAQTILSHGNAKLKNEYVPKLCSGDWLGTMCLTEPQCGSDLSLVKTMARKNGGEGDYYTLHGTKIFISCGNHDLTENILHCVLARTEGAPSGTKGLSLFAVPKSEDVVTTRIEEKMGCHGSSTCELVFNGARGQLIGELNKGLNHMFTFINTSRIGTAIQGLSACELSFQLSLDYAKNRLAMRSLSGVKYPDEIADPIIVHPDIQRMLMTQRVFALGARSMIYECAKLADVGDVDKLEFLTPVLKGFLTECGIEAAHLGIQIYGGHGYISDNPVEQIYRDARIATLYEGTTGIQALDLLGRKVLPGRLKHVHQMFKQGVELCFEHRGDPCSRILLKHLISWYIYSGKIAYRVSKTKDYDIVGTVAYHYLMYTGYLTMAIHWLRIKNAGVNTEMDNLGSFYYKYILPRVYSHRIPIETFHSNLQ